MAISGHKTKIFSKMHSCYNMYYNQICSFKFGKLEKYNYATITNVMDCGRSAALMSIEVEIYDVLSSTRLQVIGDKQVESLFDIQK